MKVGIDLVEVKRIKKIIEKKETMKKIFHDSEITDNLESLAGIFAAKEAYFKALGKKRRWLDIEIKKDKEGKPHIPSDKDTTLSITHAGDYAAAVVIIKNENSN